MEDQGESWRPSIGGLTLVLSARMFKRAFVLTVISTAPLVGCIGAPSGIAGSGPEPGRINRSEVDVATRSDLADLVADLILDRTEIHLRTEEARLITSDFARWTEAQLPDADFILPLSRLGAAGTSLPGGVVRIQLGGKDGNRCVWTIEASIGFDSPLLPGTATEWQAALAERGVSTLVELDGRFLMLHPSMIESTQCDVLIVLQERSMIVRLDLLLR